MTLVVIFFAEAASFFLATLNIRACSKNMLGFTLVTDAGIAGFNFFLVKRISETGGWPEGTAYALGAVVGSAVGMVITKGWQEDGRQQAELPVRDAEEQGGLWDSSARDAFREELRRSADRVLADHPYRVEERDVLIRRNPNRDGIWGGLGAPGESYRPGRPYGGVGDSLSEQTRALRLSDEWAYLRPFGTGLSGVGRLYLRKEVQNQGDRSVGGGGMMLEGSAQPCGCDPGCKPTPYYREDCPDHGFKSAFQAALDFKAQKLDRKLQKDLERDLITTGRGGLNVTSTEAIDKLDKFITGATRNVSVDKPDYEGFLSPEVMAMYGRYMQDNRLQKNGEVRASDNWQQGIPLANYMKSLLRHVFELWYYHRTGRLPINTDTGYPFTQEQMFSAIMFNVMGYAKETLSPSLVNQAKHPISECRGLVVGYEVKDSERCNTILLTGGVLVTKVYCSLRADHRGNHSAHVHHNLNDEMLAQWKQGL